MAWAKTAGKKGDRKGAMSGRRGETLVHEPFQGPPNFQVPLHKNPEASRGPDRRNFQGLNIFPGGRREVLQARLHPTKKKIMKKEEHERKSERGRDGGRDRHKTGRCAMGREGGGKEGETGGDKRDAERRPWRAEVGGRDRCFRQSRLTPAKHTRTQNSHGPGRRPEGGGRQGGVRGDAEGWPEGRCLNNLPGGQREALQGRLLSAKLKTTKKKM